jgi:hypothetical protein
MLVELSLDLLRRGEHGGGWIRIRHGELVLTNGDEIPKSTQNQVWPSENGSAKDIYYILLQTLASNRDHCDQDVGLYI